MHDDGAPIVDFGVAAADYARHRPGFPSEFFDHLARLGVDARGYDVLDLGTGTGTLARGFAQRGATAVGLDPSADMLAAAESLAEAEGLDVRWVRSKAESTPFDAASFDVVSAGQCWHWFDRERAGREAMRLLRPGGHAIIAYFSYLPEPGTVAEATEALVLRHHPGWSWAGFDGRYPGAADDLREAGFVDVSSFEFVLPVRFTHESWRGRFRACNGVLTLGAERAAAFDRDLAALLAERFPEPVRSDHRVFGIVAKRP